MCIVTTDTRPVNADLAEARTVAARLTAGRYESFNEAQSDTHHAAAIVPALIAKVEAPRAVLGPLLEGAVLARIEESGQQQAWCFCCGRAAGFQPRDWRNPEWEYKHEPDCPTLHADELMGRACE
jgi:hypothetical protein